MSSKGRVERACIPVGSPYHRVVSEVNVAWLTVGWDLGRGRVPAVMCRSAHAEHLWLGEATPERAGRHSCYRVGTASVEVHQEAVRARHPVERHRSSTTAISSQRLAMVESVVELVAEYLHRPVWTASVVHVPQANAVHSASGK